MIKKSNVLEYTWELPQNLIGEALAKIIKATPYTTHETAKVYSWNLKGGISLGSNIFVAIKPEVDPNKDYVQKLIKHEYGHTVQSRYLGWLYLFVIGIPSIIWASCFAKYREKNNISYYTFYTEKWADHLGGVQR